MDNSQSINAVNRRYVLKPETHQKSFQNHHEFITTNDLMLGQRLLLSAHLQKQLLENAIEYGLDEATLMELIQSIKDKETNEPQSNQKQLNDSLKNQELTNLISANLQEQFNFLPELNMSQLKMMISEYVEKLSNMMNSEQLLQLFRTDLESQDALISYLDNIAAMKGSPLVKDKSMYETSVESLFDSESFFHIFGSDMIEEIEYQNKQTSMTINQSISEQILIPNIIEIILFEELLTDKLPNGMLNIYFFPNQKESTNNFLNLIFLVMKQGNVFIKWKLQYCYHRQQCLILEENKEIGLLNFVMQQKKYMIHKINGSIRGNSIALINKKNTFGHQYKAIIGHWRGKVNQMTEKKTEGKWVSKNLFSKKFSSQFNVEISSFDHIHVSKKIIIGEDQMKTNAIYHNKFPIPIFMSGLIRNNKFIPPKTIQLPTPFYNY